MKKARMDVLIIFTFFIFASQMLHIFGKLTVLRGSFISTYPVEVKLICLSEDDGGALVWNYNLIWEYYTPAKNNYKFEDLNKFSNNEIDCKMNASEGCLETWIKNDWNLTNSFKTPMGPVFDQRWEEFKQYENYQDIYDHVDFKLTTEVKLSFSIRVARDAHVLICNGINQYADPCYWIIIGGWGNSKSVIRKCITGVPVPGKWPEKNSECRKEVAALQHTPLSSTEWRSFTITWDPAIKQINVYNTKKVILSYTDTKSVPYLRSSNNYHMFIRSDTAMLYRFHIYDFLHTTVETAVLTSPVFRINNKMICVQLLVGLCAECDAHVVLRTHDYNKELVIVTVKGLRTAHGLPMWQSVKITKNISEIDYNSGMIIQLIPKLNRISSNPLWAIANVRQCPQNALRRGIMNSKQDWGKQFFWPFETCQKLFYDEHAVVNPLSRVTSDINTDLDDSNCFEGKIGPRCLFSCKDDLLSNFDCGGTEICYHNGCTCASSFTGSSCDTPCASNQYGRGCKKECGSCLYKTEKRCNKITGECSDGCDNRKGLYLPPLCQISVDKPNAPTIISTTETTIWAAVSVTWKEEYDEISVLYSFVIQGGSHVQQPWNELFQNMTQLQTHFEKLEPGTTYHIAFTLDIAGFKTDSDWQIAETGCNPAENFVLTAEENGMIIDWRISPNQLYSCPASWYYLIIRNINTSNTIVSQLAAFFPYKVQDLQSYTSYDVIIGHKKRVLFSQEIRTLEGIPSRVLELRSMLSANTVILMWKPPYEPNGEIVGYEVTLMIMKFYGCGESKLSFSNHHIIQKSTTEPTITFPDLHPYAFYCAQVIVHNTRYFSSIVETTFSTEQSDIPSEVFSQLKVQDWKLLWSPPEDCTTISGTLTARIIIQGISDAVKYFNVTKQTSLSYFDLNKLNPNLNGAERYVATIYVIRNFTSKENASAYQKYEFETPPTAPPRVTNLEIVEIDTRQTYGMIHLRWQSPLPPLNGKLHIYGVQLCDTYDKVCSLIEVQVTESCDLWEDYICKVVRQSQLVKVVAYNINVTEPSPPAIVTDDMLRTITGNILGPDAPGNYTFTINNNSVVDLKWLHPWKTGRPLKSFRIEIEETFSNLRIFQSAINKIYIYPVTQYMRNYAIRLYLFSSTRYIISIRAVTFENKFSSSKFVKFRTPSTAAFDDNLKATVDKSDSTILLNIPTVLNDTRNSVTHIIVKGPNLCEQYTEVPENLRAQAGVKMDEIAWQAAEVTTNEYAGERFRIGDDLIYGNARNCPLKPEELYEIVVIVTEQNSSTEPIMLAKSVRVGEVPPKHHEAWIVPIVFLAMAGVAFYLYRRKKQKFTEQQMQDEMILSQNIENYEQENKSVISHSKEDPSTPSDRQSLSRATTPEELPVAVANDDEEEEMTSLVKVKDFEDYVRRAIQSGLLDKQYETFHRGQTRPWDYGKLPQNKSKNRYGNLIAYDETRVVLKKFPDDVHSDYINANYITGYKKEKRYIATQGPKPNTVIDFWRMIWQEHVLIICMLANVVESGKTKCEQYWPDIGKKKKYGDIFVLNAKHNVFADYCFRTFNVTCGKETRKIEHLHYTAWPDHGVPLYTHSVVTYLKKLLATPPGKGPVVVHCSAGVGRTGTIILCDICLHRAAAEGVVDVFTETASIRNERANMVDNKQQYLLAHLALVECLLSVPTTLPCNEMLTTRIKELKKQLPIQQQRLQNTAWQDEALRQVTSPPPLSERNRAKNRFPELLSEKVSRIYLKRYPTSDEDSDYLSAVYVDGVKLQNQYLATQLPMPSTINDFWRMIAELKVELILMLQPPDLKDPTCCSIAPANGEFKPVPYLNVTVKEVVELEYYTSQKLLLVDNSEKPSREQFVTILCLTEWKSGRDQPPPPVMTMVTFWQAAERIARGDGPTVTLCHDGVTGCGLYLALSFLLERMAVERECDVCLAVRAVRRSRADFVRSLEHLEYLYEAAVTYLEYFETYANFS
ncbi:PREDICTED: receptor-type tyrosine-protein phosphatase F-like [Vollenhovia emeryi]|uniref:receptor-type tyrosine-protein phosphatase F-like n=1 Tax=Vollenhovia emeryi TaxID=411798 RepID=UPI0005F40804|nr:PREDICTED: receptor-type tyrosine-protein phosphatase F-like [Vollenhovia emeryi]